MSNYESLANRIGAKKYNMVKNLLNRDSSLDLTYDNGTYFRMSIENNSYDIVKELLNYFEENQLSAYEEESPKYLYLKGQLQYIITDITEDSEDLSPELVKLLKPYLLDQFSTADSSNKNSDSSDPIDKLDPVKHFSHLSTKENTPEKDAVDCTGDLDTNADTFDG